MRLEPHYTIHRIRTLTNYNGLLVYQGCDNELYDTEMEASASYVIQAKHAMKAFGTRDTRWKRVAQARVDKLQEELNHLKKHPCSC